MLRKKDMGFQQLKLSSQIYILYIQVIIVILK